MKTIEGEIQDKFAKWLRSAGYLFICPRRDQKSTISAGYPDFTIFLPGPRVILIETKAPGEEPRPTQQAWHEKLAVRGFEIYVCDSVAKCIGKVLSEAPQRRNYAVPEEVIFGNGVFRNEGGSLIAVRPATDRDRRNLRTVTP